MNPLEMIRVGVFEGRFMPIHRGHTEAAVAFMEQMKLDYLFVVPDYIPEEEGEPLTNPSVRLKLCELAFDGVDGVIISDAKIRSGGRLDTLGLLRELEREDTRLFMLCGSDVVLDFGKRADKGEILSLCYPSYVRREDDPLVTARIVPEITELYNKYGKMFRRIVKDSVDISSTRLRAMIKNRELDLARKYLPERVADYIKELEA